jgi:hypothetical protein
MRTNRTRPPAPTAVEPRAPAVVRGWREAITLSRMALAFLFPSPFMTRALQDKIELREKRLRG